MSPGAGWARFWYGDGPAARLAAFRSLLAVSLLTIFVPRFAIDLADLAHYEFHFPIVAALPHPPAAVHAWILAAMVAGAVGLLSGVAVRASAWIVAGLALWIVLLDMSYFKHNLWLTIQLLFLIGLAPADRIRLWHLFSGRAHLVRAVRWPEQLVRLQIAVAFGYGTVHKIVSSDWGLQGKRLANLANDKTALVALAPIDAVNDFVLATIPGAASVFVIGLEALVFALLLRPRPWWLAAATVAGFALYIEFLLRPMRFGWVIGASVLLLVPAGVPAVELRVAPGCGRCQRRRRWVAALDWLGRTDSEAGAAHGETDCAGWVVEHAGETLHGLRAATRLGFVSVTPVLLFVALAGAFGLRWRTPWLSSADTFVLAATVAGALGMLDLGRRMLDARRKALATGAAALAAVALGSAATAQAAPPNVVFLLADDMGFSDLASDGGEIDTPTLDRLAAEGVRFSQFYATPRCSPTRDADRPAPRW